MLVLAKTKLPFKAGTTSLSDRRLSERLLSDRPFPDHNNNPDPRIDIWSGLEISELLFTVKEHVYLYEMVGLLTYSGYQRSWYQRSKKDIVPHSNFKQRLKAKLLFLC